MSGYLRTSLGTDFGYTPGEQPSDIEDWLKLNSNELPLPPSPSVAAAVADAAAGLARYPSPVAEPLRSALARLHGVDPEQVFVANGADQVLDSCFRAYAFRVTRWCVPSPDTRSSLCWRRSSQLETIRSRLRTMARSRRTSRGVARCCDSSSTPTHPPGIGSSLQRSRQGLPMPRAWWS